MTHSTACQRSAPRSDTRERPRTSPRSAPRFTQTITSVMRAWLRAGAVVCAICAASPARSHLEIQAGKMPFFDGAGAVVGGYTSWGVVLPDGDNGRYARVCEESYDPAPAGVATASFATRVGDAAVLIGGYLGTFWSRDAGCTLEPVPAPLAGHSTSSFVRAGPRLLVATFDLQGGNGVFASDDDGASWSVALAPVAGASFFRMAASDDGMQVVATGTWTTAAPTPAVFLSEDGGATWTDLSPAYAAYDLVTAGAFDDRGALLLGGTQLVDGAVQGHVLEAESPFTAPVTLGLFPAQVTHVVALGEARFAVAPLRSELYAQSSRAAPFVMTHDLDGSTPEPAGPTDCLAARPDGTGLVGCAKQNLQSVGMFLESDDGSDWRPVIDFGSVGYRVCAPGTAGAAKCARYVETSCRDGADNDFDGFTDCADVDCLPCTTAGDDDGGGGSDDGDVGEGAGSAAPGQDVGGARGATDGPGEGQDAGAATCAQAGMSGLAWFGLVLALARRSRRPGLPCVAAASRSGLMR